MLYWNNSICLGEASISHWSTALGTWWVPYGVLLVKNVLLTKQKSLVQSTEIKSLISNSFYRQNFFLNLPMILLISFFIYNQISISCTLHAVSLITYPVVIP